MIPITLKLRCLLRRTPAVFPSSVSPDDPANDLVLVYLTHRTETPTRRLSAKRVRKNKLLCERLVDNAWVPVEVPISELSDFRIEVRFFYKGWTIVYNENEFQEAFVDVCAFGIHWKRLVQRMYDRRLRLYTDRYGVLENAVNMEKNMITDERSVTTLSMQIYGVRLMNAENGYDYITHTRRLLSSFIHTGEVVPIGNPDVFAQFRVTPKAYATLGDYELEMAKHGANVWAMRWQAIATFVLCVLTAVLVYVTYLAITR